MSKYENKHAAEDLIYLVSCAVNDKKPDPERISRMDDAAVFRFAGSQKMTAAAAYALRKVSKLQDPWKEAYYAAVRRKVLYDTERRKILRALDERGIWYLPLKGIILKDDYPDPAIREMTDNDILCDGSRMEDVRTVMTGLGFQCALYGKHIHDKYTKSPLSFEMHWELFGSYVFPVLAAYFAADQLKKRMIRDDESRFGYHLTDEDFYLYILCHMYKHYARAGIGLRSLMDIYVFLHKNGAALDRDYLERELEKLGIAEFERKTRLLAEKVFSFSALSEDDREELAFFINSGTYGDQKNKITHTLDQKDGSWVRLRYASRRIFPDKAYLKSFYPTVYRHRVLYPLLVIYRPFKGLVTKRKKLFLEYRYLKEYKRDDDPDARKEE